MARPQLEPGTHGKVSTRLRGQTWQARATGRTYGGLSLSLSGKGHTEAEAVEDLERSLRELTVFADGQLSENSTINHAIDAWLSGRRAAVRAGALKQQSYEKYASQAKAVRAKLGAVPLHQARPAFILPMLESIVLDTEKGGAPRARAFRVVLQGAFSTAVSREAMPRNPLETAPKYRSAGKIQSNLDPAAFVAMRESIIAWGTAPRRRCDWQKLLGIVDTAMGSSIRIGEVLALRPIDIDFSGERPTLEVTGTIVEQQGVLVRQPVPKAAGQERIIPLPRPVARNLGTLALRVEPAGLLFGTRTGQPDGNPDRLLGAWKKSPEGQQWMQEQGIPAKEVTFKLMRRTAATKTRKTLGLDAAQALLGHAYSSTTDGSYAETPRVDIATADVLEEMWGTDWE